MSPFPYIEYTQHLKREVENLKQQMQALARRRQRLLAELKKR